MLPLRRDLRFPFQRHRVADWHRKGRMVSLFMNNWSLYFPVGERFFIHAVRHYQDRIEDPELQAAVRAFIGQEAMHGREHDAFNAALAEQGYPVERIEAVVAALLEGVKRMPRHFQLSATVALEHFTAMMGARVLEDPYRAVGSDVDPAMQAMWHWHALEETEHKAVAFDVYQAVMGRGPYAETVRASGLVIATLIFFVMTSWSYLAMLRADPVLPRLGTRAGWREIASGMFGDDPGILRKSAADWLAWFRPGFHPWQHDNRHHLRQMEAMLRQLEDSRKAA